MLCSLHAGGGLNKDKWLYLANLIEMLQDEVEPDGDDQKITLGEVADMMNEPGEGEEEPA